MDEAALQGGPAYDMTGLISLRISLTPCHSGMTHASFPMKSWSSVRTRSCST